MSTTKITNLTLHKTSLGDQMSVTYAIIAEDGTLISQNKRKEFVLSDEEKTLIQNVYDLASKKISK